MAEPHRLYQGYFDLDAADAAMKAEHDGKPLQETFAVYKAGPLEANALLKWYAWNVRPAEQDGLVERLRELAKIYDDDGALKPMGHKRVQEMALAMVRAADALSRPKAETRVEVNFRTGREIEDERLARKLAAPSATTQTETVPVAPWSDFSGKWYTPYTARLTVAEQKAETIAKDHEGRTRPLYASPQPDTGIVMVPREPTEAMKAALWQAMFNDAYNGTQDVMLGAGWDAMLAAAPPTEQERTER
jgi:hypothetical protein